MVEKWADYDKNATGWITPEDLAFLMYELPPPLGRSNELEIERDKIICNLGLINLCLELNRADTEAYGKLISKNRGIQDL